MCANPLLSDSQEILDRLVAWAAQGVDYEPDSPWGEITTDCAAAADEIKRLREALEAIVTEDSTNGYIMQQIAKEALYG